jgi:FkbM family methyltransferase
MLITLDKLKSDHDVSLKKVIHVGAHYGQEYDDYQRHGATRIVWFEPQPHCLEVLRQRFGDNPHVKIFDVALGNEEKDNVTVYQEFVGEGQSSSLLKPLKHLELTPHVVWDKQIQVSLRKLDGYIEEFDSEFNFLNLDVQGYELEVMKGGVKIIKNLDYIYTEVNRDFVYEGCAMVWEIDAFLDSLGFARIETCWGGGIWGDALYVNKRILTLTFGTKP